MTQFQAGLGQPHADTPSQADAITVKLDLVGLFVHAAWPVKLTIGLLALCSLLVWIIAMLKLLQLARLRMTQSDFDRRTRSVGSAAELFEIAGSRSAAPGSRIIRELYMRGAGAP